MSSYTDNKGAIQTTDTRNIDERFRWWDHEAIVDELDKERSPLISVFVNEIGDFNLSSAIRSGLWYLSGKTYIVGRRKWDRRGAVGSHLYQNLVYFPDMESAITDLRDKGYRIVAAEVDERGVSLPSYQWVDKSAVIYGEEGAGISQETLAMVDDIVEIPRRGSIRSLNVAATASTFLYDYSVKTGFIS